MPTLYLGPYNNIYKAQIRNNAGGGIMNYEWYYGTSSCVLCTVLYTPVPGT